MEKIMEKDADSHTAKIEKARAKYRAFLESRALPGESIQETEARLRKPEEEALKKSTEYVPEPVNLGALLVPKKKKAILRLPPEDERQADFFIESFCDVPTKDNRSLMDVALFKLSKAQKRAGEVLRYELPDGYVEIKSGTDGMASIWDYDIVLMMVSHLTGAMNRFKKGQGDMPGRTFIPHVSDIAKFCRRGSGGRQANDLIATLDRLHGTTIKSVRTLKDGQREVSGEGLIASYKVMSRTDSGKISSVQIECPNWIYDTIAVEAQPEVLTVSPDYFLIEQGLGRFIYRLARRAAGNDIAVWSFRTIYERSGSKSAFKEFSRILRELVDTNELPEYRLQLKESKGEKLLVMIRRKDAPAPQKVSGFGSFVDEDEAGGGGQ